MTKLVIRSAYADMISPFQSDEATRYYLAGFNAEPHPAGGVLMVATDGHTMGVFHEAKGVAEAGAIWALSKETMKACKPAKSDDLARWLVIVPRAEGSTHDLAVVRAGNAEEAEQVAKSGALALVLHQTMIQPIDGTFPDYQRVVPAEVFDGTKAPGAYNGTYLAKFARVAGYDLGDHGSPGKLIRLHASDAMDPAVVLTTRPDFFGVIMPMRFDQPAGLPAWWDARTAKTKAA